MVNPMDVAGVGVVNPMDVAGEYGWSILWIEHP